MRIHARRPWVRQLGTPTTASQRSTDSSDRTLFEIDTVTIATDLPELGTLRDEQRRSGPSSRGCDGAAPPVGPGARGRRGGRADGDGGGAGLPRLVVPVRPPGPARLADVQPGGDPRLPRRPGRPTLAVVAARRALAGDDPRPLPARDGAAGRGRAPAPRPAGRPDGVVLVLAGDGAAGGPPGVPGARRRPIGGRSGTRRRTAAHGGALLVALLIPAAFALGAPDAARLSFARWLLGSNERWPQRTYLTVTGLDGRGRLVAPRDERFTLEVRSDLPGLQSRGGRWVVPGRGEPLALRRKPESPRHAAVGGRAGAGGRRGVPRSGSWSRRAPRSSGTSSRRRPRRRPSTWSGATTGSGR